MGSGAADIAEIVSDIKTKLPDLDAPPRLDSPEQARFRLFGSITAFLKTASRRKPIMPELDELKAQSGKLPGTSVIVPGTKS